VSIPRCFRAICLLSVGLAPAWSECAAADSPCVAVYRGDKSKRGECIKHSIEKLSDRSTGGAAVEVLDGMDEEALPDLFKASRDDRELVRAHAVEAMGRIAKRQKDPSVTVCRLVELVRDPSPLVVRLAIAGIARVGRNLCNAATALESARPQADTDKVLNAIIDYAAFVLAAEAKRQSGTPAK
jgi:HEAT repeat protein